METTAEQRLQLTRYCEDFARDMLERYGSFYPYGAVINAEGGLEARGSWSGEGQPDFRDLYRLLLGGVVAEAKAGTIIAAAIAVDVSLTPTDTQTRTDALRVKLECEGYSRFVFFPYAVEKKGLFKNTNVVSIDLPFTLEAPFELFPP